MSTKSGREVGRKQNCNVTDSTNGKKRTALEMKPGKNGQKYDWKKDRKPTDRFQK